VIAPLRVRWLGRVAYREALSLQEALFRHGGGQQHLLLLEHHHVFTHGARADLATNVLVEPASVGAELVRVNRGGDVTYHGPGQLVGYPILSLPSKFGGAESGLADSVGYVCGVEQTVIDTLVELGLPNVGRLKQYPGVWVDPDGPNPRKICAIGVRLNRGRTMHGFALNVTTDMRYMRDYIIPCGIAERPVTSLAEEGIDASLADVANVFARYAAARWGSGALERQDVAWFHRPDDLSAFSRGEGPGVAVRSAAEHGVSAAPATPLLGVSAAEVASLAGGAVFGRVPDADLSEIVGASQSAASTSSSVVGSKDEVASKAAVHLGPTRSARRLEAAGVTDGLAISTRKPEWLRPKVNLGAEVMAVKSTLRDLGLVTVCEEAGCPNLSECWADGTATFMILGERCTRACGFCLVDTRKPMAPDADEPARVAEAVARMKLAHAVVTMVARDDLADGGAAAVAATIAAIRDRSPQTKIEVLISDLHGSAESLEIVIAAKPDVLNHNTETVARLQRAVRPSAGYARSLGLLSRGKLAGLTTKSGLIVGMGETDDEVHGALADLAGVGVDIVTIGQYLRPTTHHLPVARWVEPSTFDRYKQVGEAHGIGHVQASPLTRSSYHARQAAADVLPEPAASFS
jgi:lipoyl synthase